MFHDCPFNILHIPSPDVLRRSKIPQEQRSIPAKSHVATLVRKAHGALPRGSHPWVPHASTATSLMWTRLKYWTTLWRSVKYKLLGLWSICIYISIWHPYGIHMACGILWVPNQTVVMLQVPAVITSWDLDNLKPASMGKPLMLALAPWNGLKRCDDGFAKSWRSLSSIFITLELQASRDFSIIWWHSLNDHDDHFWHQPKHRLQPRRHLWWRCWS